MFRFTRRHMPRLLACVAAMHMFACYANATTYFVAPCGNNTWAGVQPGCTAPLGPKRTIQAAINASVAGDTIIVLPGTYFENIDFDGKAIALTAAGGPATTIIDGGGGAPTVRMDSFEPAGTSISGFTIRNGYANTNNGAGMRLVLAVAEINNCIFRNNFADTGIGGGGLAAMSSNTTINNCQFIDNTAFSAGGALIFGGTSTITNCTFDGNNGMNQGGGLHVLQANASVTNTLFTGGQIGFLDAAGAGAYISQSTVTMTGCSISDNTPFRGSPGIHVTSNSTVSLIDCEFMNNHATDNFSSGGGVYALDSTVTMFACNFTGNDVSDFGGAVYANNSSIEATLCGFLNNSAGTYGGAIAANNISTLEVSQCTFGNNDAFIGGAIQGSNNTDIVVSNCAFSNNEAQGGQGGAVALANGGSLNMHQSNCTGNDAVAGGAVWVDGVFALGLQSMTFQSNSASGAGGAVFALNTHVSGQSCTFANNSAGGDGGAISFEGASSEIFMLESAFTGNSSATAGGAIRLVADARILECGFSNNSAPFGGAIVLGTQFADVRIGASQFSNNSATQVGSAIMAGAYSAGSKLRMVSCLLAKNTAPVGGGALHESALGSFVDVRNCSIVDNAGGGYIVANGGTSSLIANSIVWGNTLGAGIGGIMPQVMHCNTQGAPIGVASMSVNPQFVNPATGNYRLTSGSPCVDAGHNSLVMQDLMDLDIDYDTMELSPIDLDGNPRFANVPGVANTGCGSINAIVDLGAFERVGQPAGPVYWGDIVNSKTFQAPGDGIVDGADLAALLGAWGSCEDECCPADFDLSGQVDGWDLALLLGNWS